MKNARKIFLETLTELAEKDPQVVLVTCDVGFSYIEDFKARFPNQYLNLGVTEQSTVCICAALAKAGLKPYFYTMVNFIAFRPYEQVRNAVCMMNANVKFMSVVGWTNYKFLGYSHNINQLPDGSWEDEQVMRYLPNMNFYIAQDLDNIKDFMIKEYDREGPAYIRLG
jgi:transketolase